MKLSFSLNSKLMMHGITQRCRKTHVFVHPTRTCARIPGALYDMKNTTRLMNVKDESGTTSRHSLAIRQMAMVAYLALVLKEPYSSLIRMATSGTPSLRHLMRKIFPKMSPSTPASGKILPLMNMTFPTNASDFGPLTSDYITDDGAGVQDRTDNGCTEQT